MGIQSLQSSNGGGVNLSSYRPYSAGLQTTLTSGGALTQGTVFDITGEGFFDYVFIGIVHNTNASTNLMYDVTLTLDGVDYLATRTVGTIASYMYENTITLRAVGSSYGGASTLYQVPDTSLISPLIVSLSSQPASASANAKVATISQPLYFKKSAKLTWKYQAGTAGTGTQTLQSWAGGAIKI